MRHSTPRALVITDLDGTLLDHHSYDWQPAKPALDALRARHIPVVFNTSKTRGESRRLQREMNISGPVIVENGSCIASASGDTVLGCPRSTLLHWLAASECHIRYRFQGFSEMGVEGIMRTTGLDLQHAVEADQRAWSEPLLWEDTAEALQAFGEEVAAAGFHMLRGGRFVHLQGDCDKGRAALALLNNISADTRPLMVALGDSQNDLAMLEVADRAFWIRSPVGNPPFDGARPAGVRVTTGTGPTGWNEAMTALLEEGLFDE